MNNITCVIIDDEPMARKGLQSYVDKIDFLTLVGVCKDAIQLNNLLKAQSPDLLFLDIEMPFISGLDFLSTLQNSPKVIITSAYEKYALKGYEFNVVDYLLKPISFDRFLKAVNRVYELYQKETTSIQDNYIFVKSEKKLVKLSFKDILFIEGLENYITIYTQKEKIIVHSTLKCFLEELPGDLFIQTHRSFIVNMACVESIEGNSLLINGHRIPIARNLHDEVLKKILP